MNKFGLIFLVVVIILLSSSHGQRMNGNLFKRENQGFYTTRFGRRSDPSMAKAQHNEAKMEHMKANERGIGQSVEGYDDQGNVVHCVVASGSKGLYICQRETDENWVFLN
ncbi:hypothetical protein TCAL_12353 [Tigriopus californicus]|uniref:Uncharacterized protein n=1 Tax=Tigriopus californicus TaxID=6832 RepID=A0A553P0F8_TIGCA|nr:uncharacterized protein LOC131886878 [Tigriopus californicus]TRY71175.1 hypothetical protein TCAL_12353 [Tigriopus californicus]|eukprot:TCALIF_12353-PA protein Name:"Protein of unknown function" AED:0.00 eAED:0.00 QI:163/1/1/1/0/0.25/4/291/109